MKKGLFYIAFVFAGLQAIAQTWQATNLTSVTYLPVTVESHANELYGTVFNGSTATFNKLNSDNTSWSTIATGTITTPRFLQSAGSKLYVSSLVSGIYSLLYYTTDGGNNFIMDTVGLPKYFSGVATIYGLQYYNGKVIANLGSSGYYLKDTAAVSWQSINVVTALNGGVDPVTYLNDTLFAYDNTGTHTLYVSGDYGTTWTVRTTDLPSDYGTSQFTADETIGRLYSAGLWNNSTQYALYYSDNMGRNWTLASNASAFMSLNAGGTLQLVTSLYAKDNVLYMALQNNKNPSAPDIIGSTTGLANLAYDTLGLPANAAAGVNGVKFLKHKNKFAVSLNVIDVYLKDAASGFQDKSKETAGVSLFPNPVKDHLYINNVNNVPFTGITILDVEGKVVLSEPGKVTSVAIAALPKGIYFIQLLSGQKIIETQKFIRE